MKCDIKNIKEAQQKLEKKLKRFKDNKEIIEYARTYIDKRNQISIKEKKVSCKKKCSHCCFIPVIVFSGEIDLIQGKHNKKIYQMRDTIEKQKDGLNNWYDLSFKTRKCIFLKKDECTIYKDRPLMCRAHLVDNISEKCDTTKYNDTGKTDKRGETYRDLFLKILENKLGSENFSRALFSQLSK